MHATSPNVSIRRSALTLPRVPWGALPVVGVTVLAAVLRLSSLAGTLTNPYYDAAVRSMSQSWHNFFFAAFDPSAGVSIDKPPVDLWLQVASVKLFGFGPTTLVLPEAIAGTLAVPLLYDLVRRVFGRAAALASALALALIPISVVTSRSDTMDSLMMALNVLAAWLVLRAVQTGRKRHLFAAAVVMGLNFEVKLFEALLALPALGLLYALGSRSRVLVRGGALAGALAIFVAVALSWPTAVSLTPASARPYAIGSTNGSVWNAIFVFNGSDRISPPQGSAPRAAARAQTASAERPLVAATGPPPPAHPRKHRITRREIEGRITNSGTPPGPRRLFDLGGYRFGQDLGIELAPALAFGLIALLVGGFGFVERRALERRQRLAAAPPAPAGGPLRRLTARRGLVIPVEERLTVAAGVAFAVWLLFCVIVFSRVKGVLHPRYLEAMTPAVAAAFGIGLVVSIRLAARRVLGLLAFVAALAVSARYAVTVAEGDHALATVTVAAAAAACAAALAAFALARRRPRAKPALAVALVAAGALSLTSVLAPATVQSARIVQVNASDSGRPGAEPADWVARLSSYLRRHDGDAYYELAAASYGHAAPLIVHDGRPVLVLTGFGRRPIVRLSSLEANARRGAVRYALIEGSCGNNAVDSLAQCPKTVAWIRAHAVDVTTDAGLPGRGVLFRLVGVRRPPLNPAERPDRPAPR